jgi:hypothetical protein
MEALMIEQQKPRNREYVYMLAFLVLLSAHLESKSFPIEQAVKAEARGCIAQYGPGERYARPKRLECAQMVEAPAYVMTMPVGR